MHIASIILALICTIFLCMGIILVKWIIAQLGAAVFAVLLLVMSVIFMMLIGDEDNVAQ